MISIMASEIRILTEQDADSFLALRRAALRDAPGAFLASPEDDFASSPTANVRELLRPRPESLVFGAFVPELSGMLGFRRDTTLKAAHKANLWGMFVLPAGRGRGLALQLMRTAIEHARMLEGVASLHLCVSDAAPDAQRLYERVGFRTWGVELDAIRVAGRSLNDHHMSLTL